MSSILPNSNCTKTSSNCIVWDGPDIPCLSLCKGTPVTAVLYQLAMKYCDVLAPLSEAYDLKCLTNYVGDPTSLPDVVQGLIDKICDLQLEEGPAGPSGAPGLPGAPGNYIQVVVEAPGANCVCGGVKIIEKNGADNSVISEKYVCNGCAGQNGQNGAPGQQGLTGQPGLKGDKGDPPTLVIGTVVSGTTAAATITGTAPNYDLNLTIPKGDKGDPGTNGAPGLNGTNGDKALMCLSYNSSSHTLATGPLQLAVNPATPLKNLGWQTGSRVRIWNDATHYMEGQVTSAITNPQSTDITVNIDYVIGTGTFNTWTVCVSGDPGSTGQQGTPGLVGRGVAVFLQNATPAQLDFNASYGNVPGFGIDGLPGSNVIKPGDIWIKPCTP